MYITIGNESTTDSRDDQITIALDGSDYDILALTHELTNRTKGALFRHLDSKVRMGEITPQEWAEAVIGVETEGFVNKIIVAAELEIKYEAAESVVRAYWLRDIDEDRVYREVRKVNENAIIKSTHLPAMLHYTRVAEQMRRDYLKEE